MMLRRCIWQIARENFHSSSRYCTTVHVNEVLNCQTIYQSLQVIAKKRVLSAEQSFRPLSTTTRLSVEAEVMDGSGDRKILNTNYEELLEAQKKGVLIIDVREQSEIDETGKLPGSIHIPMGNVTNLLTTLSDDAFKSTFEKPKPHKDSKIILSCRSGMRSGKVQEEMQKLGYENVYNYNGGWLDWESRQRI